MKNWEYNLEGYNPDDIELNGNRFMLGNGYMGLRGTLEEQGKEELAGILLNGVYDQVPGKWREPVNAPNALYTTVEGAGGIRSHRQQLDLRHGRMSRETVYAHSTVTAERFVSMDDVHLICQRYSATGTQPIRTGIDKEVWDINGPHFHVVEEDENGVVVQTN